MADIGNAAEPVDVADPAALGTVREDWSEHVATAQAMEALLPEVRSVAELVCQAYAAGGVVYTFGNGGSAADAQHFTGELIGHYKRDRRALPAVTISTDPTVMTCIANDYDYDDVFARQLEALARPQDVVCGFSTSGGSRNVVAALKAARGRGATTVLFGGGDGGAAKEHADRVLLSPSKHTPRIQEMHTLMLHAISEVVDAWAAETETEAATPAAGTHSRAEQAPAAATDSREPHAAQGGQG
ncbi:SIS domain-containing protein [Lysobacter korlensis]|uniref:SIS domain-containing protein n=1 Tax=Lysobacter korlensis TaxID=553636 RepID=A0ABV6RVV8_9GAMM